MRTLSLIFNTFLPYASCRLESVGLKKHRRFFDGSTTSIQVFRCGDEGFGASIEDALLPPMFLNALS